MEKREAFKFPSNVKQIGSIDEEIKIYVEDYAYTYICQYAKAESFKEKIGILIGEYVEVDGKLVVLISGLIQGKYSDNIGGNEVFTEESWEYIKSRKERYFEEYQIVGWLHTQSSSGTFISDEDKIFHEECFIEPYQVLFLMDSNERMDSFFVWDDTLENLREAHGYFIYYDKNKNMQEYILDNKLTSIRPNNYNPDEMSSKEDSLVNYRKYDRMRKEERHQKKVVNMLVGTSGVVIVLCFLMGLVLIQNSERMNRLEEELVNINNVYKQIAGRIQSGDTAVVFASQDDDLIQKQSEPSNEEEQNIDLVETTPSTEQQTTEAIVQSTEQQTIETTTQPTEQQTTEVVTQPPTKATEAVKKEEELPQVHIVKAGDSLTRISTLYYGTNKMVNRIMEYNNIKDPDKVVVGMKIKLPKN